MFHKYFNQFGKAEAEWALEVLDMHGGDEQKSREALLASVCRIIAHRKRPDENPLSEFDHKVDACCFAAGDWWNVGLRKLRELGKTE